VTTCLSGTLACAEQNIKMDMQAEKEKLIKGSPFEQKEAMDRLRDNGEKAVSPLCDVIENEKSYAAKRRAAVVLEEVFRSSTTQTEEALSALEHVTKNPDTRVANIGAMAVMSFKGNMRARRILKELIPKQTNEQLRARIIGALMVNIDGDKGEIPFLSSFMSDKSEYVHASVAGYLGRLGDKRGLEFCKEVLERKPVDDKMRMLQMQAAIAAGEIGDIQLLPALKKVMASTDYGLAQSRARWAVKEIELKYISEMPKKLQYLKATLGERENVRWAVQQLIKMNTPEAIEVLKWAANEKNLVGAQEARQALAAISMAKTE